MQSLYPSVLAKTVMEAEIDNALHKPTVVKPGAGIMAVPLFGYLH